MPGRGAGTTFRSGFGRYGSPTAPSAQIRASYELVAPSDGPSRSGPSRAQQGSRGGAPAPGMGEARGPASRCERLGSIRLARLHNTTQEFELSPSS